MKSFEVKGRVWIYPGLGGWHFINVDKEISAKIKSLKQGGHMGFVKVLATLGKTSWNTSLFPSAKTNSYLLAIKAQVRKKEDVWDGDEVEVKIEIL